MNLVKTNYMLRHLNALSLNLITVNQLFPGFAEGDFALIHGSPSVLSLTSLLCVRVQLANQLAGLNSKVIFIDE